MPTFFVCLFVYAVASLTSTLTFGDSVPKIVNTKFTDGRIYKGEVSNHRMHGKGVLLYPDGGKYSGGFDNGKRHGIGHMKYSDANGSVS